MPEVFLAWFPVSVISVLVTRAKNEVFLAASAAETKRSISVRRAQEKASGTHGTAIGARGTFRL